MNEQDQKLYQELANYCQAAGLKPKKIYKKNTLGIEFVHTGTNCSIVRFGINQSDEPTFEMRYFANKQYPEKFHDAIRAIIESYKGEYVGCYKCGNCQGQYKYQYPDGRKFVRCGFALVPVTNILMEDLPEIQKMIDVQNQFYTAKASAQA